jgi:hypothetical protein
VNFRIGSPVATRPSGESPGDGRGGFPVHCVYRVEHSMYNLCSELGGRSLVR